MYTVYIHVALGFAKVETVKRLVFNSHSTADGLHQFMQIHFHHRQGKSVRMMTVKQSRLNCGRGDPFATLVPFVGFVFGPSKGKRLLLLMEDLHLPTSGYSASLCGEASSTLEVGIVHFLTWLHR